ncbi:MAG: hypothetical protein NC124_19010 [Clostridium sp.]|nr:hypothetical protein [Clostridium sp.]MCM1540503.1 hypothetical protein [Blautia sp.]
MILAINYADRTFERAQIMNSKSAFKFGADHVICYGPDSISEMYKQKNIEIWSRKRGGGYWIWKPYIIKDALSKVEDGDYVIYTDSGAAFINKIDFLIRDMNRANTDIMVFSLPKLEKQYTKRDAFILMGCDKPEFTDTPQRCGTYLVLRKSIRTEKFIDEYLKYVQDKRIVTDDENVMGKSNYEGFIEHRHDQSVLSLLSKKYKIDAFRDPSQYGLEGNIGLEEVCERSTYPQVLDSHRDRNITTSWFIYKHTPANIRLRLEELPFRYVKSKIKGLVQKSLKLCRQGLRKH